MTIITGTPAPATAGTKIPRLELGYLAARPVILPGSAGQLIRLVLVGCGGTGSWLAPGIARLAWEFRRLGREMAVEFWDGDKVSSSNIPRQNFCQAELHMYKAEALALRYSAAWSLEIAAYTRPFDPKAVEGGYSRPLTIIMGAVDNALARRSIAQTLDGNDKRVPKVWWCDAGNFKESGQILLGTHNRVEELQQAFSLSCNALPSPALQHPELLQPLPEEQAGYEDDKPPRLHHRQSCAELAAADFQSLTINKCVAGLAEDMLMRLLGGRLTRFATYLDNGSGTVRSCYTTPEEVARVLRAKPGFFRSA